jgi:hypothetical protein
MFIRGPALLAAPVPIRVAGSAATTPVLCLGRVACVGELTLRSLVRTACGGATAARNETVGSGAFQLEGGKVGTVPIAVGAAVARLTRCTLGLSTVTRVALASAEMPWSNEAYSELVPDAVPAGRRWSGHSRRVANHGGVGPGDFAFAFDGRGLPYTLFNTGETSWLVPPGGRPHRLATHSSAMASFDRRHVLIAGTTGSPKRAVASYSLMRGASGIRRALDPGHHTRDPRYTDPVVVAADGHGRGLAVVRRQHGKSGEDIVARFIGHGAHRARQVVKPGGASTVAAAIDRRGNAVVAWCDDPKGGFVVARAGGRFGRAHSLGPNVEGDCFDIAAAFGPGGRFTIVWSSQVQPYNPPNGPLEVRVTTGVPGKRARSFTADEVPDRAAPADGGVGVAYSGTHAIVAWSSADLIAERSRVWVSDLAAKSGHWLSPAATDAEFTDLASDGRRVAAVWGPPTDYANLGTGALYASYAQSGIDFGPPERVAGAGRGRRFEAAAIAFAPATRRPTVVALGRGPSQRSLLVARRPR